MLSLSIVLIVSFMYFIGVSGLRVLPLLINGWMESKLYDVSCSFKCHIHTRNKLGLGIVHRSIYTDALPKPVHKPL